MSLNHDWRDAAACAGMGDKPFFNKGGPTDAARAACAGCTVRAACLEDALTYDFGDDHGFQGGMTRNEREGERAKREHRVANARALRQRGPLTLLAGGVAS